MGGIYFGDGRQVLDYRIHVTHYGPHTTSDIFLKGAVADRAQAVWTGLMRIEKPAVGTSAFETNRNLVLSDGAKVHSVPNLEILTDDLQCGHGSSSGPLDEDQLYYLMSRGLPRDKAERLLVRGFFNEILSKLAVPGLAPPSRAAVAAKFAGAQQRGSF
jgi:Fe-S cluster assembly protein SufD